MVIKLDDPVKQKPPLRRLVKISEVNVCSPYEDAIEIT